jgi:hypothetical protein
MLSRDPDRLVAAQVNHLLQTYSITLAHKGNSKSVASSTMQENG